MIGTQLRSANSFTAYQAGVVALLALVQFTVLLDGMLMPALVALLLPALAITTGKLAAIISIHAFSAGAAGLVLAGFADRFDRKKLLLFVYGGFTLGTFLSGVASTYVALLAARVITGTFGGMVGSVGLAIITDLFRVEVRGRAVGFVQAGFAACQVLGVPAGLWLAGEWGWSAPFLLIGGLGLATWLITSFYLLPLTAHLAGQPPLHALRRLVGVLRKPGYGLAFLATGLLIGGGFILVPFSSAFVVNNLGVSTHKLPLLYTTVGVCSLVGAPLAGRVSDGMGKYALFSIASGVSILLIGLYCNLTATPFRLVIGLSVLLFIGLAARMVAALALITAVPAPEDRGAFMSLNTSLQQLATGLAAALAGWIVRTEAGGALLHYDVLGYLAGVAMLVAIGVMH